MHKNNKHKQPVLTMLYLGLPEVGVNLEGGSILQIICVGIFSVTDVIKLLQSFKLIPCKEAP